MKFSKSFISLLRNFAQINKNMNFVPGNVQTTIMGNKTGVSFFARIKTDVDIDEPFALMDLDRFLEILGIMNDPEIRVTIPGKQITISDATKIVNYTAHVPDLLLHEKRPERFKKPVEGIGMTLTKDIFSDIIKMNSALNNKEIIFGGDGEKLFLQSKNFESPTTDLARIDIGDTTEKFSAVIKASNLKIIPGDYELIVCRKGYVFFEREGIEYIIPVERKLSSL